MARASDFRPVRRFERPESSECIDGRRSSACSSDSRFSPLWSLRCAAARCARRRARYTPRTQHTSTVTPASAPAMIPIGTGISKGSVKGVVPRMATGSGRSPGASTGLGVVTITGGAVVVVLDATMTTTSKTAYSEKDSVLHVSSPVTGSMDGVNGCIFHSPFTSLNTLSSTPALPLGVKGSASCTPGSGNTVPVGPKNTGWPAGMEPSAAGCAGSSTLVMVAGPAVAGHTPGGTVIPEPEAVRADPPEAGSIFAETNPKGYP
mmetsp:Transcript_25558/g.61045  ORF Transcript_25558/g.61045 Transcript_25558/m.61045 type:complete len:263 (+) Transcript_25558:752-1540(+)